MYVVDQNALFDVQRSWVEHEYRSSGERQNALVVLVRMKYTGVKYMQVKHTEWHTKDGFAFSSIVDFQMRFVCIRRFEIIILNLNLNDDLERKRRKREIN